ncbi:lipopolysaccharide biosynthesis protein [Hymenobacter jeollabukensis]|uniref:Lipopolysaccharide biosynthesis protein n=1 Tax=Hymenobacter jeollabukensis TaxID=2025313 RepID=A0A5R8WSB0_9BACT|nr:oligosaccharide flippase family protein [Hymenobacter jeollabukensis]TLM93261.1 hypothetical protein FDY95_11615 [Hymenobacter jeollabukensis]
MINRLRSTVRTSAQAMRQRGSFAQNFAVTLSGTTIVAAIGFALTPIMSRIYPPASYGQFAVFGSVVGNLNLLTTLGYPGAMLMPKLRERFLALVHLSLLLTMTAIVVLSGLLVFAAEPLRQLLHLEGVGGWLYTVPLLLLLFNLNAIMFTWYTRDKAFTKRAGVDIATTLSGRAFTIGYGWWFGGPVTGLILGEFFNRITAMTGLLVGGIWRQTGELWRSFNWQTIKSVAREYKDFPLYILPAGYVNTVSSQLPIFALTTGFGSTVVGLYSFSVSLLEIPINLIGNAISPVFAQKAIETHQNQPERLPVITLDLYYKLLYLGILPFGGITVFGDWIFKIVFGARWEAAGMFTAFLGYYYVFKLTSLATSGIYTVYEKQRYQLIANAGILVARAVGLGIGLYLHNVKLAMLLFGLASMLGSFITDLHILSLLRLPVGRIALRSIALTVGVTAVLYVLRLGIESLHLSFLQ